MKDGLSPAVSIVAIVVVIALVAAIGYFVVKPRSDAGQPLPENAQKRMQEAQQKAHQQRGPRSAGPPGSE